MVVEITIFFRLDFLGFLYSLHSFYVAFSDKVNNDNKFSFGEQYRKQKLNNKSNKPTTIPTKSKYKVNVLNRYVMLKYNTKIKSNIGTNIAPCYKIKNTIKIKKT